MSYATNLIITGSMEGQPTAHIPIATLTAQVVNTFAVGGIYMMVQLHLLPLPLPLPLPPQPQLQLRLVLPALTEEETQVVEIQAIS
jgi:hypothetical protein